jgi:hypothetical protein
MIKVSLIIFAFLFSGVFGATCISSGNQTTINHAFSVGGMFFYFILSSIRDFFLLYYFLKLLLLSLSIGAGAVVQLCAGVTITVTGPIIPTAVNQVPLLPLSFLLFSSSQIYYNSNTIKIGALHSRLSHRQHPRYHPCWCS